MATIKRPLSVEELLNQSRPTGYDPDKPLDDLLQIATTEHSVGKQAETAGDLESAFIHFARASTLMTEELPTHPKFVELTPQQMAHGQTIFDSLDAIKPVVSERVFDWLARNPEAGLSAPASVSVSQELISHVTHFDPAPEMAFAGLSGGSGLPESAYLTRGAAADIWILPEYYPKRIRKVIRISQGRLTRNRPDVAPSSQPVDALWKTFLEEHSALTKAWSSLRHSNVAQVFLTEDGPNVEVAYYGGGCVRDYLKAHSSVDKVAMISHVLAGMRYLHEHDTPIIHGNVNAGKLFVDDQGTTVVGEFGLAALCYPFAAYAPSVSFDGLSRWFSPELLDNDTDEVPRPTLVSDVWALGCTIYEILRETLPYSEHTHEIKVQREILAGKPPGHCDDRLKTSAYGYLWSIVESCWTRDPGTRPDMATLAEKFDKLRSTRASASMSTDMITDFTPMAEVVTILGRHGCPNITRELDLSTCSDYPILTGGLTDIYSGKLYDGTQVAIKLRRHSVSTDWEEGKQLKLTSRELYTWSKCKHPNVASLLGLAIFRNQVAIISSWIERRGFGAYIEEYSSSDRFDLCIQVADGLAYLHSIGAIHGDLKGGNVLISREGTALISGFECAFLSKAALKFEDAETSNVVTTRWAAPELFEEIGTKSTRSDVYALGMTILEAFTGKIPYSELNHDIAVPLAVIIRKEMPARSEVYFPSDNSWGDELWKLLTRCWSYDPKDRPTASEVRDRLCVLSLPRHSPKPSPRYSPQHSPQSSSQHDPTPNLPARFQTPRQLAPSRSPNPSSGEAAAISPLSNTSQGGPSGGFVERHRSNSPPSVLTDSRIPFLYPVHATMPEPQPARSGLFREPTVQPSGSRTRGFGDTTGPTDQIPASTKATYPSRPVWHLDPDRSGGRDINLLGKLQEWGQRAHVHVGWICNLLDNGQWTAELILNGKSLDPRIVGFGNSMTAARQHAAQRCEEAQILTMPYNRELAIESLNAVQGCETRD